MARLKSADCDFLKGVPELWTVVLDQMARDESIVDVRAAIRNELADRFDEHRGARTITEDFCLASLVQDSSKPVSDLPLSSLSGDRPKRLAAAEAMARLIRHRPVALLLAADRIKNFAAYGHAESAFAHRFPHDLVQEAARAIAGSAQVLKHLSEWLNGSEHSAVHPMAASLLHAAVPGWRPGPDCRPRLSGAYLARAAWPGLNLSRVEPRFGGLQRGRLELGEPGTIAREPRPISTRQSPRSTAGLLGCHSALIYTAPIFGRSRRLMLALPRPTLPALV